MQEEHERRITERGVEIRNAWIAEALEIPRSERKRIADMMRNDCLDGGQIADKTGLPRHIVTEIIIIEFEPESPIERKEVCNE